LGFLCSSPCILALCTKVINNYSFRTLSLCCPAFSPVFLSFSTNPESAPNWEQIPANRTRPYGEVPQNFSEEPLDLTNFPAADDSIESERQQQQQENQGNGGN